MHLPKSMFSFIFHFVRQQWIKFLALVVISAIWAINDTFFPYFLKRIVNTLQAYHGNPAGIYAAVKGTLILLMLFWLVTEIALRTQGITQIYTFPRFRTNIRRGVFDYVKSHSHDYFASQFAGNIAKKLADLPTSCQTVMEIICFQITPAMTGATLVLIMMWQTKPIFAVILFCWLCFHLGITFLFLGFGNHLWEKHSDAVSVLSGKVVDVFTNILNVRLFARGRYESEYLHSFQNDEIAKAQKAMWLVEIMRIGLGLNGLFLIFAMIFTLLYGWVHHWVTLGDFTQVGMQSFWLLGWIWFISFQITIFAREAGTIGNALSIVRKGHDLTDKKSAYPLIVSAGEIRFEDVSFAYHKNQPVFQNLNVVIPGGQKIGLVGFFRFRKIYVCESYFAIL